MAQLARNQVSLSPQAVLNQQLEQLNNAQQMNYYMTMMQQQQ